MFRGWETAFGSNVDFCPVQLPGRETRWSEPPYGDLRGLLEALEEALVPWMDVPFALFGHSLGGVVSFELARTLRAGGHREPIHLFVSGSRAPQRPRLTARMHDATDGDFVAALRLLGTVPQEVLRNEELLELVLPALRADFRIYETYAYLPGDPLGCPISIFGGERDHLVGYDDLSAWRGLTTGGSSLRLFPGGHFFVRNARNGVLSAVRVDLLRHLEAAKRLSGSRPLPPAGNDARG
jgi:medium-chain acyl-[acyl-carrier-protein] hydrolase